MIPDLTDLILLHPDNNLETLLIVRGVSRYYNECILCDSRLRDCANIGVLRILLFRHLLRTSGTRLRSDVSMVSNLYTAVFQRLHGRHDTVLEHRKRQVERLYHMAWCRLLSTNRERKEIESFMRTIFAPLFRF